MKLDSNIYGADDTGCAHDVAMDGLSAPKLVDPLDQSAKSRSSSDSSLKQDDASPLATVSKSHSSNASDNRAVSKGGHATTARTKASRS